MLIFNRQSSRVVTVVRDRASERNFSGSSKFLFGPFASGTEQNKAE